MMERPEPLSRELARALSSRTHLRVEYKVRLSPSLAEHIRRHAFERAVPRQTLMSDVLQAWAHIMTDPAASLYDPVEMGVAPLAMPPERSPGYLETLGFVVLSDGSLDPGSPQLVSHRPASSRLHRGEPTWENDDRQD